MRLPEDVTVAGGHVYVTDAAASLIRIYDGQGVPVSNIGFPVPSAIAVLPDGTLVVGSYQDRSVRLLTADGRYLGSLGRGAGEFVLPRNIVVDDDRARIGVVDPPAGSLKWYDYNGVPCGILEDGGNLPQDAVVLGDEVFVAEHPFVFDQYGGEFRGAAIRVYSADGEFLRSFGSYGTEIGELVRPRGLAVGPADTILVVDSFHGAVFEFSPDGEWLGVIESPSGPMQAAGGAAAADGRLYVVSSITATLHRFAVGDGSVSQPEGAMEYR